MIEIKLTGEQKAALAGVASTTTTIVNLAGVYDYSQPFDADAFAQAHLDAMLALYVTDYKKEVLARMSSLGSVLAALPAQDQHDLIQALIEKARVAGVDTTALEAQAAPKQ